MEFTLSSRTTTFGQFAFSHSIVRCVTPTVRAGWPVEVGGIRTTRRMPALGLSTRFPPASSCAGFPFGLLPLLRWRVSLCVVVCFVASSSAVVASLLLSRFIPETDEALISFLPATMS